MNNNTSIVRNQMGTIRTHNVTLAYDMGTGKLILRPVSDEDIPLLCSLNSDPEVLCWADDENIPYDEEKVRGIWGYVSPMAFCFIAEVDGVPIGDCWLQRMNLKAIQQIYPKGTDIRRIDMSIGKREYWNQGIGTAMIRCLVIFAFEQQKADVLHCICNAENIRSVRVWEKNGFRLRMQTPRENPGKLENHYVLTREEYFRQQRT